MFNLEHSITDWRRQLSVNGIKAPEILNELEVHLREDVERLVNSGVGASQAFAMATRHIGTGEALRAEFMKSIGPDQAQLRRRAGHIYAATMVFYFCVAGLALLKEDATLGQRLLGFSAVLATLLSVYLAWQIVPRLAPLVPSQRFHHLAGIFGGISGTVWFVAFVYLILPRFNFTPGQLVAAVLWATLPMLLLPTISFLDIEKSEPRPTVV